MNKRYNNKYIKANHLFIIMLVFFVFLYALVKINAYGWVPLIDLKTYNTKNPSSIKVYNKELVIWEKDDRIIVQDNACIHRNAPLSEGYIDKTTKNLCCSYHGWIYQPSGYVRHIPQMTHPIKTCLKLNTYKTRCHNNVLFINMDNDNSELPDHILNVNDVCDDTVVVELPYNMKILLENFFDPAHIPFAHHNLQSKRMYASSVNSTLLHFDENKLSISFEDATLKPPHSYRNGTMTFYNPNHYELCSTYPTTSILKGLQIYCVPICHQKTRIFMQQTYSSNKYTQIYNRIPVFIKHALTNTFLDSDTMILYKQQQYLNENNANYIMPTTSDKSIVIFHKWLNKYKPVWSKYIYNDTMTLKSREEVFDRYNAHTKHCKHCKSTLNNIKNMQIALIVCTSLSVANHALSNLYISFAFILYYGLEIAKSHFIYRDYVHNELTP